MPFTPDRIARVNALLKREIADVLEKLCISVPGALISVVKVNTSSTLRNATVYVSIFGGKNAPPDLEAKALALLESRRADIQNCISRDVILKYTPVLRFTADHNIAEGDKVLDIIRKLEEEEKNR